MIADVAVVGGGPAGTVAAMALARAGWRTLVLEALAAPRMRPGETLHPGVEPLLRQLGVENAVLAAQFHRHPGVRVRWDGGERYEPYGADARGPWLGFQAVRETFDEILLAAAGEAGAIVWRPCRALSFSGDAASSSTVVTDRGEIRARFVIDAGGPRHWLARQLSLTVEQRSRPLRLRYGWRHLARAALFSTPLLRADRQGWVWIAQTGDERVAWVRLRFGGSDRRELAAPGELRGGHTIGWDAGADGTWRMVSECAGLGWFIVGDAAAILDPASSHGVLRALMSGMQAAHLASAVLNGRAGREEAATLYRNWFGEWFTRDCDRLAEIYSRHPSISAGFAVNPLLVPNAPITSAASSDGIG